MLRSNRTAIRVDGNGRRARSTGSATGAALALIVLSAFTPAATAQSPSNDWSDNVAALLDPVVRAGVVSGVLLIGVGDEIAYSRSVGYANWEHEIANDLSTRFGLASLTKALTAVVASALAAEGRLDFDRPVADYIDGFPSGPNGGRPTIRDLLTHQSGVPHRVTEEPEEAHAISSAEIVERVIEQGLLFEPGSRRLYSSAGYTCLARVIEIVEGQPFSEVLEQRIFEPAAMIGATDETGEGLMPHRASPHRLGAASDHLVVKKAPYKDLRFLSGAGSVYATAVDVFRFVRAVRNGAFGPSAAGLLWEEGSDEWQGWEGRTNGYNAFMDFLPSSDVTLVFVSNLQSVANWQLRAGIQSILTGDVPSPVALPPPVAPPFESPEDLLGSYDNQGSLVLITRRDGDLFRGDNEFYPIEGKRYYIPGSGTVMRFRRDAVGAVDALVTIRDGGEMVHPRINR